MRCVVRLWVWARALSLCLPLLLPIGVWVGVPLHWAGHDRVWWALHTPACWGPVCINVWPDHIDVEIALELPG